MTKKKAGAPSKAPTPAPKKKPLNLWMIVGTVVIVGAVIGVVWASSGKPAASAAPPEEQKYIGRFLTSGYQEAKVGDFAPYTTNVDMSPVESAVESAGVTIPLSDVTSKKNVSFQYASAKGTIPLIAYVKPSGKLFVGVSYCIPCQGTGQQLASDGTLTCTTCGTKRNPETQVGISGACKLYPLDEIPATVQGGKVVVDKAVLDNWTPQPKDRQVGGA